MGARKITGRNVTVLAYSALNPDTGDLGGNVSIIGQWKKVEFRRKNEWGDVTSADADEDEMEFLRTNWTASCEGLVTADGSAAMDTFDEQIYLALTCTVVKSGVERVLTAKGGVDEASMTIGAENGTDDLHIKSVGIPNSFVYD